MAARVKSAQAGRRSSGGTSNARPSSTSSAADRKVVGQYMLGKTIGEGTFGKVKIATHLPTGEKLAVKILEKARIRDQADVRRVNREIKILKKTRHPNIIQLYEVLDTESTIYLIMENAEGGEMFDYIVSLHRVPERDACIFFHQIINGVESLHNNYVTHRDLKPENLLLKPAAGGGFVVKIVDFGLSNTHEGGKLLQTACGSPCYAAPEMIAGKEYVGPVADMWSIGVILFALVCGYLPFEDQNTSVLYRKILSGTYSPPNWISAEVKDLIRKILECDPRKRYTVKDVRLHPWYTQVQESDIPVDVSLIEDLAVKNEALTAMKSSGVDMQALLDGLASRSCNSTTAMYHMVYKKLMRKRGAMNKDANAGNGPASSPRPSAPLPALEALSIYPNTKPNNPNMDLEKRVREADDATSSKPIGANFANGIPSKYNNLAPIIAAPGAPNPSQLNVIVGPAGVEKQSAHASPFAQQFVSQHPTLPPNTVRQQMNAKAGVGTNPLLNPYQQPPQLVVHPHSYNYGHVADGHIVQLPDRSDSRAHSAGSANSTRGNAIRQLKGVKQPLQVLPKQGSNGSTNTNASSQSPYVPKLNLGAAGTNQSNRAAYIHDLSDRVAHGNNAVLVSQTAREPSEATDGSSITPKLPLSARAPAAPAPSSSNGSRRPVITGSAAYSTDGKSNASQGQGNKVATVDNNHVQKSNVDQIQTPTTRELSVLAVAPMKANAETKQSTTIADLEAGNAPIVVPPALAEILGINPEDIERPSTRRSHMRSRGGDSRENEGRPQSGMGDDGMSTLANQNIGVVPMGRAGVSNPTSVPYGVAAIGTNQGGPSNNVEPVVQWPANRQPEKPPVVRPPSSTAPTAPNRPIIEASAPSSRPSNSAGGGRRGKNLTNIPA